MQIRIPKIIFRAYGCFEEWGNKRTFGLLRIDMLMATAFFVGGAWSFYSGGWIVLAEYVALFVFIALCCLWMGG